MTRRLAPPGTATDIIARKSHSQSMHARALSNIFMERKGNFKNSLWRHSNRKRKQLTSHERSPLRRRECRERSAICRFVRSEFGLNPAHVSPGQRPTGRFRQPTRVRVVGKLYTAQRLVQISLWRSLSKLILGHVIFECKRHYSYDMMMMGMTMKTWSRHSILI